MAAGDAFAWEGMTRDSALGRIIEAVLVNWPEHAKFLRTSFSLRDPGVLAHRQDVAAMIERLSGGQMTALCSGYRWMCEMVREEDLYFRRHRKYRLGTFEEADTAVYSDYQVMDQYMKGLLLSQILWSNHALILSFFIEKFLGLPTPGGKLVEVGPGHGLLLALAAKHTGCTELAGWDVSTVSLERTAACLRLLDVTTPTRLEIHNVLDGSPVPSQFDRIILSEVCEHLEQPLTALRALRSILVPGGCIFVNMPVNAPATDHIYLLTTPEEVVNMVRTAEFDIEDTCFAPASGYSEAEARRRRIPISVGVIGRRPPGTAGGSEK
jgi:2-polyprenyl-3-methyl-5-hydroxy-6-metoxy-1,4-benzoquinol methylase